MVDPQGLQLDAQDTRILAQLQKDARLSMAELGRRVHLSQPAVTERVRKLEAAGVIVGYRAVVNAKALGYGISAMVRVGRCEYARMIQLVESLPEISNAWNVTGEDTWMFEISVVDVEHLDAVVSRLAEVSETSTAIVLRKVREHQALQPVRALNEQRRRLQAPPSSAGRGAIEVAKLNSTPRNRKYRFRPCRARWARTPNSSSGSGPPREALSPDSAPRGEQPEAARHFFP